MVLVRTASSVMCKDTVAALREKVEWIAPITVYPGEDELLALTQGALRVLNGEEEAKIY